MSTLPTYGASDLDQAMAAGYAAAAGQPANLGPGSQMGPIFKSVRLAIQLLQNENEYVDSISRLQNMVDPLPNGLPNPDVDTFINAFNFFRPNGSFASGVETFTMPSPVSMDTVIPVGATVQSGNGVQYEVAAGGAGYNQGAGGYIIVSGQSSVNALIVATTPGSVATLRPEPSIRCFRLRPSPYQRPCRAQMLRASIMAWMHWLERRSLACLLNTFLAAEKALLTPSWRPPGYTGILEHHLLVWGFRSSNGQRLQLCAHPGSQRVVHGRCEYRQPGNGPAPKWAYDCRSIRVAVCCKTGWNLLCRYPAHPANSGIGGNRGGSNRLRPDDSCQRSYGRCTGVR